MNSKNYANAIFTYRTEYRNKFSTGLETSFVGKCRILSESVGKSVGKCRILSVFGGNWRFLADVKIHKLLIVWVISKNSVGFPEKKHRGGPYFLKLLTK